MCGALLHMVTRMTLVLHMLRKGLFACSSPQCQTLVFIAMLLPLLDALMKEHITETICNPGLAVNRDRVHPRAFKKRLRYFWQITLRYIYCNEADRCEGGANYCYPITHQMMYIVFI